MGIPNSSRPSIDPFAMPPSVEDAAVRNPNRPAVSTAAYFALDTPFESEGADAASDSVEAYTPYEPRIDSDVETDPEVIAQYAADLSLKHAQLRNKIMRALIRKTGTSRENAEDAVQEAFLAAWTQRNSERRPDLATGWLYKVAFYRLTDGWKNNQGVFPMPPEDIPQQPQYDDLDYKATLGVVQAMIAILPYQQRRVAQRLMVGQEISEIASALSIQKANVRTTASQLRSKLRKIAHSDGLIDLSIDKSKEQL